MLLVFLIIQLFIEHLFVANVLDRQIAMHKNDKVILIATGINKQKAFQQ